MERLNLTTCMVAFIAATGCHHPERTPVERGQGVFLRSCAGCHGPDARGTHPPGFTTPPRDLTDPVLQARLDDAALRETIRYGKGQMPPFGAALVPDDVNDLVAYVRTLKR
jgi:mono/diheme cytochrome c family protein